jgi:hypothetical protein
MSCPGMAMLRTRAGLGRAEAALKHAHRRCPFLARNPGLVALPVQTPTPTTAKGHVIEATRQGSTTATPPPAMQPEALKLLASRCPVMAPVIHSPSKFIALSFCIRHTHSSSHFWACVCVLTRGVAWHAKIVFLIGESPSLPLSCLLAALRWRSRVDQCVDVSVAIAVVGVIRSCVIHLARPT